MSFAFRHTSSASASPRPSTVSQTSGVPGTPDVLKSIASVLVGVLLLTLWLGFVGRAESSAKVEASEARASEALFSTASPITLPITYTSSWDGSLQHAYMSLPSPPPTSPVPLLIYVHGMFSCRATPPFRTVVEGDFAREVAQRGWILVAPELHGERPVPYPGDPWDPATSCPQPVSVGYRPMGARPAQRDLLDVLAYVDAHYPIARDRVYLLSESAGGLTLLTALAKFPDRFAAAVVYSSPSDLARWLTEDSRAYPNIWREVGGLPTERPFDYARRSPLSFAENLSQIPLVLVHGREDERVPVHHSRDLYAAIRAWNADAPVRLIEYEGTHSGPYDPNDPEFFTFSEALDWFATQARPAHPLRVHGRTDAGGRAGEPGEPELGPYRFWWVGWRPHEGAARWTRVSFTQTTPYTVTGTVSDTVGVTLSLDVDALGWDTGPVTVRVAAPLPTPVYTTTLVPVSHTVSLPLPGGRVTLWAWAPTPVPSPTPTPTPTPTPSVARLTARVFEDRNGNGVPDPGEPGIAGARVRVLANASRLVGTCTTPEDGRCLFPELTPGAYLVREENAAEYPLDTTVNQQFLVLRAGEEVTVYFGDRAWRRAWLPVLKR